MNRTLRIWTVCGVAAMLVVAAMLLFPQSSRAQAPAAANAVKSEVIMMRCKVGGSVFAVANYKGSSGTPGRQPGNCADNLALLIRDGFEMRDIGHYDEVEAPFVLYTLAR